MKSSSICKHCDPYVSSSHHISERIEGFVFPVVRVSDVVENYIKKRFPNTFIKVTRGIMTGIFTFLFTAKILKETDPLENIISHSRTLVILEEAQRRGLPIKSIRIFGKIETNYFSIMINGGKILFEGLPTVDIFDVPLVNLDDKNVFKKLLEEHGLPHAVGECFSAKKDGLLFAKNNGFPVVVKPKSGSLSKHTTCNIHNETELREAIRIAQIIQREFIIEKFIEGNVYRITIVDGNVVASCLREPPNVSGDGRHTIEELVHIKNEDPRRGYAHQRNFTLHKIQHNSEKARGLLAQHGVNKDTILPQDKKIYFHDKVTSSSGADIHDTTDLIHQDNISLFKNVYGICGIPVIGIDFIIKDISRSYRTEQCAILEVNSLPYIDMHHYPTTGTPRDVAGAIMDMMMKQQ